MDYRNIIAGKIERNDPENYLASEIDVYYRYNWALAIIKQEKNINPSILELGCGLGWFGKVIANAIPISNYLGIDIDEVTIAEARRRYEYLNNVRFMRGDVCRLEQLEIPGQAFDYIVWFENLEHLQPPNFSDLVMQVKAYLKPTGSLLVEVPNRIGGGGLWASGPLHLRKGQHNPHHYFEPTLAEARFLFPRAKIEGYELADHLPGFPKRAILALARICGKLGLLRAKCYIDHQGAFTAGQLAMLAILRCFPSLNRCFLIRDKSGDQ